MHEDRHIIINLHEYLYIYIYICVRSQKPIEKVNNANL